MPSSDRPVGARLRRCGIALLLVAALAACGPDSPDKLIASGRAYLDKQNPRAAIIELKNALQSAPDRAEARFLLGRALLDNGDAASAVVELGKARTLKQPEAQVLPWLARAMNAAGQSRQVVDEFAEATLPDADALAELKSAVAAAYAAQGNLALARQALAAARQVAPDNVTAALLDARLHAGTGDANAALAIVDAVLRKATTDADALALKGDLLRIPGAAGGDAALAAYRQALSARKSSSAAHAGIISILLERQQTDAAATQIAEMKKFWPASPQARWFEAQVAYQRRDLKEAGRLIEPLLSASPDNVAYLHLSASVALASGAALQAENSLGRALKLSPGNAGVRRLLARTELGLGQPAKALAVIQPLVDDASTDAEALSIAGQASARSGEPTKAQAFFARAVRLNPADASSSTALALTKLWQGDTDGAVSDLRGIAASSAGAGADVPLIAALLRRNDVDGALDAVTQLEKKQPTAAVPVYLRGVVLLARQNVAGARASFERALTLDPKLFVAAGRLAALDLADKQPQRARQRFERILAVEPKNMRATMALIDLREAAGASRGDIAQLLADAIKLDPLAAAPRLRLVDLWLGANDAKAALATAQAAAATLPDNPPLREALARAQWAAGERSQAMASYTRLAADQPQSALPHLRLAEIQLAASSPDAAAQSIKRALAIDPGSLPARRQLVALELQAGHAKAALDLALGLQKLRPTEAEGYLLEGDVQMGSKNWAGAAAAYRQAYAIGKPSIAAAQWHAALLAGGKRAEADSLAAARLKEFPNDLPFLLHLGDEDLARTDFAGAEARFAQVLRIDPKSTVALNNLAWVMVQLQKKGGVAYAEQANALRPDYPPFVDTLARALAFEGQTARAVALQKKLVDSQPDDAGFRLQLARLYVQTGDKALARVELERLYEQGDKVADQAEVGRLLKTL